jgi:hypothetical protein
MVASLVRVLHSGPQDMRLLPKKGPTDISAYIRVLTRAGRMTTQWGRLDFQQRPDFGKQAVCRLLKKGELITRLYLVTTLPDIYSAQATAIAAAGVSNFAGPRFGWTNSIGHALIESATIDIGGSRIEQIDSRLLEIYDEYNTPLEKILNKNTLIGRKQNGFTETSLGNTPTPLKLYIPLPFWFSKGDLGAALPIDAIHVDEIRVSIQFRAFNGCYYTDSRAPADVVVPTTEGSALWPISGSPFYEKKTLIQGGEIVTGLALNKTFVTAPPIPPETQVYVKPIPNITMPTTFSLGDTYLLAEYIYLDKPEANRFRLADIEIPITQHYRIEPRDTRGFPDITVPMELPNPTRHLYFMAQNYNAIPYNCHFLATRDLSANNFLTLPKSETFAPWWPDCSGLFPDIPGAILPGFCRRGSEPFTSIELLYEGKYVKTSTEDCSLYRSILPALEERKSPWINRYIYTIPFGVQSGFFPPSVPMGEVNMNRIMKKELRFGIAKTGPRSGTNPQRLWIYIYAESFNILKIFGGRAGLLFAY